MAKTDSGFWDFLSSWLDKKVYIKRYEITISEDEMDDFKQHLKEKRKKGIITIGKFTEIHEGKDNGPA